MHFFHSWTPWFRTRGGHRDMYFDFVLYETPTVEGWGRYCTECLEEQFKEKQ